VSYKEFTIKDNVGSMISYIENSSFDLLGFSVYIWNSSYVQEILASLRISQPILLGGPEASYSPDQFFRYGSVSYIIRNEGEESFNELIEYLEGTRSIADVSNLYYRDTSQISYTFSKLPNLENIRHDLALIGDFENRICYLESSRGCPFRCAYCLASLEKKVRNFPIENVKADIDYALSHHAKTVKFLDRSFNADQKSMQDILRYIRDRDNGITVFQFEIVGDLLNDETISFLKTIRRGLIRFEIGIQSANETVTEAVNRHQDYQRLETNIRKIRDNIIIHSDLIAGLPYETKDSFIKTFNQTFHLYADELQLGFLKELKGTEISTVKDQHGYQFASDPPYEVIENRYIRHEELDEIRDVEKSLNPYYNSGHFPRTCKYLFETRGFEPYLTFLKITRHLKKGRALSSLQPWESAQLLYDTLKSETGEELLYIMKQDYLMKDEQKPKIWWENDIAKDERHQIYRLFCDMYPILTMDSLYRYSRLEKYQNRYFLVLYRPKGIFFIDE
jgi:radical SAM superfamily enzyme YgiQ (UPF0313 family)